MQKQEQKMGQRGTLNVSVVFVLAALGLVLGVVAGVYMLIIPTLYGTSDNVAEGLGVNESAVFNESESMLEDTTENTGDFFGTLFWIGVALVFLDALGLGALISKVVSNIST